MKKTRFSDMKVLAKETIEKHELSSVTPDTLKSVLNTEGYMVIRYSAVSMSAQTKHLMEVLGVEQLAHTVDSFTFTDREHRIVFVRADISDEEFIKLLALELGRIYCVKNRIEKVLHGSPNEEFAAAEFAYHLIDINRRGLLYNFFKFHAFFAIAATFLFQFFLCVLIFKFLVIPGFGFVRIGSVTIDPGMLPNDQKQTAVAAGTLNSETKSVDEAASDKTVPAQTSSDKTVPAQTSSNKIVSETVPDHSPAQTEASVEDAPKTPETTSTANAAPQMEQPPKASSDDDFVIPPDKRVYYATANGKKYHLAGCSYLKGKDLVEVSQADVDSGKYEPCSRCFKNK
ncbi:MAG: hypothetical protein ACOYIO_02780 [Eubacteriales bacterium]|jgi:hypothetical protein